jgi:hypothetical protein
VYNVLRGPTGAEEISKLAYSGWRIPPAATVMRYEGIGTGWEETYVTVPSSWDWELSCCAEVRTRRGERILADQTALTDGVS